MKYILILLFILLLQIGIIYLSFKWAGNNYGYLMLGFSLGIWTKTIEKIINDERNKK